MKQYNINQMVLPIQMDYVPQAGDFAHLINTLIEGMPESTFLEFRKHYGRPAYDPRMMMKIILCGYTLSAFSGRKIEDLLHDSRRMAWLAQGEVPSYRTINRFRVNPMMAQAIKAAFVHLHAFLTEQELIDNQAIYIDGTKIEANANKFSFVWRKSIENYQAKLVEKSRLLYDEMLAQEIIPALETEVTDELDFEQLTIIIEALDEEVESLNHQIENEADVALRKTLRSERKRPKQLKKSFEDFKARKVNYDKHLRVLGARNSYSKTDHDATFMRMKDDVMQNGQLKPGYNVQLATQNQFALAYDIYPNPTDTRTLTPFLDKIEEDFFDLPQHIVADAGYGSESNYIDVIDQRERIPLMPYGTYEKEKKRKYKNDPFKLDNWRYSEHEDEFTCPDNRRLTFKKYSNRTDKYGFERRFKIYECEDCSDCPVRALCTKAKGGRPRQIHYNPNFEYFKAYTSKKLSDPETHTIYAQRKVDVEPVFGNLKANLGFTRCHVRGEDKVRSDLGFAFMAGNIRKLARMGEDKMKLRIEK